MIKLEYETLTIGSENLFVALKTEWTQLSDRYKHNWISFTPISLQIENEKMTGGFTVDIWILGFNFYFRWNYDPAILEEMSKEGDEFLEAMKRGNLNTEFFEYTIDNKGLRFWQAVYAFTEATKIEVNGEDPFYWENKLS
jgi:hypothetical protein